LNINYKVGFSQDLQSWQCNYHLKKTLRNALEDTKDTTTVAKNKFAKLL